MECPYYRRIICPHYPHQPKFVEVPLVVARSSAIYPQPPMSQRETRSAVGTDEQGAAWLSWKLSSVARMGRDGMVEWPTRNADTFVGG